MSFDQLMQNANDIMEKAADLKQNEVTGSFPERSGGNGTPPMDRFKSEFAFIDPLFDPFSKMPDPAKYDPYIDELKMAMQLLSTGSPPSSGGDTSTPLTSDVHLSDVDMSWVQFDSEKLGIWSGPAANDFNEHFVLPIPTYMGNQVTALSTMRGVLQAHKAMWDTARTDIDNIATDTLNALDDARTWDAGSINVIFTLLSAVTTFAPGIINFAATRTVGKLWSVSAVGAARNVAKDASGLKIGGATAEGIISKMVHSIDTLRQHIQDTETHIATITQSLTSTFEDSNNSRDLVAARPALADMNISNFRDDMGLPQGIGSWSQL